VTIRVLRPDLAEILGFERFEREMRQAAQLEHPHLLSILDWGETSVASTGSSGPLFYYVTPFFEGGRELSASLDREARPPLESALAVVVPIAGALQLAHERGMVHLGVCPGNVSLIEGRAILREFGIHHASWEVYGRHQSLLDRSLFITDGMAYVGPEYWSGLPLDGRTDLYSLAGLLYFLLTGQPPCRSPSALRRRLRWRGLPSPIARAIQRGRAVDVRERFGSVGEFVETLGPAEPSKH
jgi:serine/threonine protein kinase